MLIYLFQFDNMFLTFLFSVNNVHQFTNNLLTLYEIKALTRMKSEKMWFKKIYFGNNKYNCNALFNMNLIFVAFKFLHVLAHFQHSSNKGFSLFVEVRSNNITVKMVSLSLTVFAHGSTKKLILQCIWFPLANFAYKDPQKFVCYGI